MGRVKINEVRSNGSSCFGAFFGACVAATLIRLEPLADAGRGLVGSQNGAAKVLPRVMMEGSINRRWRVRINEKRMSIR